MKGLKIIPVFLLLLVFTYIGVRFVEANREEVTVSFGTYQAGPAALGLVVLTSILLGMLIAGLFCSIELIMLVMQNRRLRRRGAAASPPQATSKTGPTATPLATPFPPEEESEERNDFTEPRNTTRFTPL